MCFCRVSFVLVGVIDRSEFEQQEGPGSALQLVLFQSHLISLCSFSFFFPYFLPLFNFPHFVSNVLFICGQVIRYLKKKNNLQSNKIYQAGFFLLLIQQSRRECVTLFHTLIRLSVCLSLSVTFRVCHIVAHFYRQTRIRLVENKIPSFFHRLTVILALYKRWLHIELSRPFACKIFDFLIFFLNS